MSEDVPVTLACGAEVDDLLEQVADSPGAPRTPHQRDCVHCQAALAEFESLWAPLHAAATADLHAPVGLAERVLSRVRAAVQSPDWAVLVQDGGVTRIAIEVVVSVVREAAGAVPGVRALLPSASSTGGADRDGAGVQVGISGSTVAVAVTVAAAYGLDLQELGRGISVATCAAVEGVVGVGVAAVSVHIDDVLT